MTGDELTFVDTNVLVYAYDTGAALKHEHARQALLALWLTDRGVMSTQILQEFYVTVTRKIARPLPPARARQVVARYAKWPVHRIEPPDIVSASELQERHQMSFWDALILISAGSLGATRLLTENLQHGQVIGGVRVDNPFVTA